MASSSMCRSTAARSRPVQPARIACRIATSAVRLPPAVINRNERVGIVSGRIVKVGLEEDAAGLGLERAVHGAGRPAGVGVGKELFSVAAIFVVPDDEVSGDKVHLLPVFVDKWLGGKNSRSDAQKARTIAALAGFVERSGQDLVVDAGRVAGDWYPAVLQIHCKEFFVLFFDCHRLLSNIS